jgi:hypothetical protein
MSESGVPAARIAPTAALAEAIPTSGLSLAPDVSAPEGSSAHPSAAEAAQTTRRTPGRERSAPTGEATSKPPSTELLPLDLETVRKIWPEVLAKLPSTLVWRLNQVEPAAVEGPDILVIAPKAGYNTVEATLGSEILESLGRGIQGVIHRRVSVRYERPAAGHEASPDARPTESQRTDSLMADPLVQKVVELFEARSVQLDYDGPDATSTA